mmetsp:Transcript_17163/g.22290  ORF Transcript_17163/g.22290 Transcript_17163/m.22290 type:complete len:376 (-) Transcript_17163:1781-2908(-)
MRRFRLRPMSERSVQAAWSQFMTANPYAFTAQTLGREANLPALGDMLMHVLGLSGKSEAELVSYSREMNERLDKYMDDMGLIRSSAFDLTAKEEEQSIENFLDGVCLARERIIEFFLDLKEPKKDKKNEEEEEDIFNAQAAIGKRLYHLLENADDNTAIKDSMQNLDTAKTFGPRLSRVTFFMHIDNLALDECPYKQSTNLLSVIVNGILRPSWLYLCAPIGSSRLGAYETAQGIINLSLKLAPDLSHLLQCRHDSDLVSRLSQNKKSWPLVEDLNPDPSHVPPKLCGFILADATFGPDSTRGLTASTNSNSNAKPVTLTFARQVDHRSAARWSYDWRLVDLDGALLKDDWRRFPLLVLDEDIEDVLSSTTNEAG